MIYMVDHVYVDPGTEAAWHAWYAEYLQKLVSVPGIHSAQRFKAIGCAPSRYLAMYSIDSEDIYSSAPYKNMGGGGSQSKRFHYAYALWTRNLFEGAARAPVLDAEQRIIVWDSAEQGVNAPGLTSTVWLKAVGLDLTTRYRAFSVVAHKAAVAPDDIRGSYIYEPFTAPVLAQ
jgi:hypothetical protein